MNPHLVLDNGMEFDFSNMFGPYRLRKAEISKALKADFCVMADKAVEEIRRTGFAKNHLSKDGEPEPVFFPRMGYIQEGNPNTEASIQKLKDFSKQVKDYDAVIFLGIGGSFLGNKVLLDALGGLEWNSVKECRDGFPMVYFAGNNVDSAYSTEIVKVCLAMGKEKLEQENSKAKIMLVPISKSGTTMETMVGFLYFYNSFKQSAGIDLGVTVVTDLSVPVAKSPLLKVIDEIGGWAFDIKKGIGGRFSIMTDPGLLTLATIGGDVEEFLRGAREMDEYCSNVEPEDNPALLNALLKYMAYRNGREIEVFMPYCMRLKSLSEWYIQLLAESLGKSYDRDGKLVYYGRTPIVAVGTTDMHAQTQQHQEGRLNKVIQFIEVKDIGHAVELSNPFPNISSFDQYSGKTMNFYLGKALEANQNALNSDNRPNAKYVLPKINEYYLGALMYYLMLSIAYEGELSNVDAYDQPGVEVYKRFMKE